MKNHNSTIKACIIGYIVQAVINNFVTLLFVYFHGLYSLTLDKLAFISAFNFFMQLLTDFSSTYIVKFIGFRRAVVGAHILSGLGLISMTVLPGIISPYPGLLISTAIYAVGGGLIEVIISPLAEACPTPEDKKAGIMSMLHSFYCWGQLGVILITTLFFKAAGIENWRIIAYIWAILPFANALYFTTVPIFPPATGERGLSFKELFKGKGMAGFLVIMLCAGACELGIAQWASAYAEKGLGLSKTLGDLLVPCAFSLIMGLSRVFYSRFSEKLNLEKYILLCGVLSLLGYTLAMVGQLPVIGIVGCIICGFAVGVMWPGTYSLAAKKIPRGGLLMFSFLALAGDTGCSLGPVVIGYISGAAGGDLKTGMLGGVVFSGILVLSLMFKIRKKASK